MTQVLGYPSVESTMAEYVESDAVAVNAINGTLSTALNAPILSN